MLNIEFTWAIVVLVLLAITLFADGCGTYLFIVGVITIVALLITDVATSVLPGWDAWLLFVFAVLFVMLTVALATVGFRVYKGYIEFKQELTKPNIYKMRSEIVGQRGVCIAVGETHLRIRVNGVEWYAWADGEIAVDDEIVVIRLDGTGTMPIVRRS